MHAAALVPWSSLSLSLYLSLSADVPSQFQVFHSDAMWRTPHVAGAWCRSRFLSLTLLILQMTLVPVSLSLPHPHLTLACPSIDYHIHTQSLPLLPSVLPSHPSFTLRSLSHPLLPSPFPMALHVSVAYTMPSVRPACPVHSFRCARLSV